METVELHEAAANAFRALEVKMRREELAITALSDTMTVPKVVYQVLVAQAQGNAATLKVVLQAVKNRGGPNAYDVMLYSALTGTDEVTARRELNEWAPPPKPTPKQMPQQKPGPATREARERQRRARERAKASIPGGRKAKWDIYEGWIKDDA